MANNKLIQEMKRHVVVVAIMANNTNSLKLPQFFVFKVYKELKEIMMANC